MNGGEQSFLQFDFFNRHKVSGNNMIKLIRTNSENSDFRALVVLLDQELRERDGEEHVFFAQFNKIDKIHTVVLAYHDAIPAGCGAIKEYTPAIAEVKRMFVHPDFRRLGIARAILSELEIWAGEIGYSSCILETSIRQPEAISLYHKMNYNSIPNYGQYHGVESSVCFEKHLHNS